MNLADWALRWSVPPAALAELSVRLGALVQAPAVPTVPRSEAAVQAACRAAASRLGWRLFRNNVGAVHDAERNVHVRFGLANDTPQMNATVKSADLIGWRPLIVQPADVGRLIGQFVSIECKHEGWRWRGDDHEVAQQRWAALVSASGGDGRIVSSESQL